MFFDGVQTSEPLVVAVAQMPVLFRLWVMDYAITTGVWPVVGYQQLSAENAEEPFFYKQDAISGRLFLYHSSFADTGYERPASLSECQGLERAAVWDPDHVVDRLRDHLAGRPNKWVESMRIDLGRLPS